MGEYYTYQKKRREMGKYCDFSDTEIKHLGFYSANLGQDKGWEYIQRDPNFIDLDITPQLSEHMVNTERVSTRDQGMYHKEGGWPKEVDHSEVIDTNRHRKKIEKDPNFAYAVKEMTDTVEKCIEQNNQIDLFEEYFLDEVSEHFVENITTKTLMLFKDQNTNFKRSVSEISWNPEGPHKIAVSYATFRFQQMPDNMPKESYIWDLRNPNTPETKLIGPSPCTNIAYNQKLTNLVAGACYNGTVAIWDVLAGSKPIKLSPIDNSHHDPVTSVCWLQMKSGTELVTTSTDGKVCWWDTRKFEGPLEWLELKETVTSGDDQGQERTVGGTAIEFNVDAGANKFLVGTESGSIITANKKPKTKAVEITTRYGNDLATGRHLGPVYSINRSIPNHRYFLSVGDWSAKIWFEDLRTPIIRTRYHGSYLSDGCFSPTRFGVFFLTRKDGWLDIWDYYYRQNELAFSHKVSDSPLTCIKLNYNSQEKGYQQMQGKYVAIGDQDGTVTMMELCESLYTHQPREKDVIAEMFEREYKKEKTLEQNKKQAELKKTNKRQETDSKYDEIMAEKKKKMIADAEKEFFKIIQENEDDDHEEQLENKILDNLVDVKKTQKDQQQNQTQQQIEQVQRQESNQEDKQKENQEQ